MPTPYFVLRAEDPEVGYRARLIYTRDYPLRSWMTGVKFDREPPVPITLKLRGTDGANWVLGDLWLTPICVMSKRLHAVLVEAGVNNLDTYAVELHDPENGKIYRDFLAFNIVEKCPVAVLNTGSSPEHKDRALLFRLAESVNTILIHERVKTAIEAAAINTLTFIELENWTA